MIIHSTMIIEALLAQGILSLNFTQYQRIYNLKQKLRNKTSLYLSSINFSLSSNGVKT